MAKIIFVSSAGGHFSELNKLRKTMDKHVSIVVTEKTPNLNIDSVNYSLMHGTRNELFKYLKVLAKNTVETYKIIRKEKPDFIISTGAHTCVPFFYIGKFFGAKTIYIESYAKVDKPSLTYRIIKPVCDKTIVQHEQMLGIYPKAEFFGGVY